MGRRHRRTSCLCLLTCLCQVRQYLNFELYYYITNRILYCNHAYILVMCCFTTCLLTASFVLVFLYFKLFCFDGCESCH